MFVVGRERLEAGTVDNGVVRMGTRYGVRQMSMVPMCILFRGLESRWRR